MKEDTNTIRVPTLSGNPRLKKQIASELAPINDIDLITEKEEMFCQLFCNGGKKYAGNAELCYRKAFGVTDKERMMFESRELLKSPTISTRINNLMIEHDDYEKFARIRVLETLYAVMEETSEATYTDRWGMPLSPAPLRAVSGNAAKAIADILGLSKNNQSGVTIQGENNVTFNVIVPQKNA